MGHISNPVGLRLGYNRVWHTKGKRIFTTNMFARLAARFFKSRRIQRLGVLYSHTLVRYSLAKYFTLVIFLYDSRWIRLVDTKDESDDLETAPTESSSVSSYYEKRLLFENIRMNFYKPILERIKYTVAIQLRKLNPIRITLIPLDNSCLSATAIANFALRKLIANNRLTTIFTPIITNLAQYYLGIRIAASGRFTRNQRASLSIFHFGKVPLNTFSVPIDYCFASLPLKFGVGSLKIWIGHQPV
jgi:hypothetical protein